MSFMLRVRAADYVLRVNVSTLLLVASLALAACGDDDANVEGDSGLVRPDGEIVDGYAVDDDGGSEEMGEDAGRECASDDQCSDHNVCTGTERCVDSMCVPGEPMRCSDLHQCIPSVGCDCADPDVDNDNFPARECASGAEDFDCNDGDATIRPDGTETCHVDGDSTDEDCKPSTFSNPRTGDGDRDGDEKVSDRCFNLDEHGQRYGGDDCDDTNEDAWLGMQEVCDNADNDCDGVVDEGSRDGGPAEPFGLQVPFYPDVDHDGTGDHDAPAKLGCDRYPLAGYVPGYLPPDCNDGDIDINIDAIELCDGDDNDCDGLLDEEDNNSQPLLKPEFTDTDVHCRVLEPGGEPQLVITDCPGELGDPDQLLWCRTPVVFGCTTDGTTLDNCRECDNTCTFACGREDCEEVTALSVSVEHSCVITSDRNIACWGRGALGRLGDDAGRGSSVPSQVVGATDATRVVAGPSSSCAVLGDSDELYCWGDNAYSQLGNTDPGDGFSPVPLPVYGAFSPTLSGVSEVAVADRHACAIVENELFCWGSEEDGRLGNGYATNRHIARPASVERASGDTVADAAKIALGSEHSCVVTTGGSVECWGDNTYGQLGDPDFSELLSAVARPVPGLTGVNDIAAGYLHTCALREGEVLCWGANDRSQLGHMPGEQDGLPTLVAGLSEVIAIDTGLTFSCALDEQGLVSCWGSNDLGERGDSGFEDSASPAPIDINGVVETFSADGLHGCALTDAKATYCWGYNNYGQLGIGLGAQQSEPTPTLIKPLLRGR